MKSDILKTAYALSVIHYFIAGVQKCTVEWKELCPTKSFQTINQAENADLMVGALS